MKIVKILECAKVSKLIEALTEVQEEIGDLDLYVCGISPIIIYHADRVNVISIDHDESLEDK